MSCDCVLVQGGIQQTRLLHEQSLTLFAAPCYECTQSELNVAVGIGERAFGLSARDLELADLWHRHAREPTLHCPREMKVED